MTDILRRTETSAGSVIVVMNGLRWWVEITSEFVFGNKCFENIDEAGKYYKHIATKLKVISIINNYTTEMEGYSYFGSNPGVSVENYDDIAEELLESFYLN